MVETPYPDNFHPVNDFLVTRPSAEYSGSPFKSPNRLFFQGKMHGNICDREVGDKLVKDRQVMPAFK